MRRIYLPYCLQRLSDGRYVVLNRNYKPLGIAARTHVDYEPHAVKFKRLTRATAKRLSHKASEDLENIFLYDDGCIPTRSELNMNSYLRRLAVLSRLTFELPSKK